MEETTMTTTTTTTTTTAATTSSVLVMSKISAMIGLGFGSLALGTLPLMVGRYRARRQQKRRRGISSASTSTSASNASSSSVDTTAAATPHSQGLLTSLLLCFGGGVLLFTTFLHLAPEVRASVERHQSNGQLPTLGTLSLAELLFCGGFFLVYLVEEAVHAALTGKPESSEALLYRTVSVRRCNGGPGGQIGPASGAVTSGSTTTVSTTTRSVWKNEHEGDNGEEEEDAARLDDVERPKLRPPDDRRLVDGRTSKDDNGKVLPAIFVLSPPAVLPSDGCRDVVDRRRSNPTLSVPELSYSRMNNHQHQHQHHHHHHHHHHDHQHGTSSAQNTSVQGLLTVLALSFHAIFEGLAVGLEPSISSVMYLAAAIATHKLVISFCVGMELYVAGASTRTTLGYLSVFSMVTPIGIAVGLALGHFKNDSENLGPTPTILQGMAAGTLLYVVFFEVLARERANEKSGLLQLVAIIVGFALMLGLQIAMPSRRAPNGSDLGSQQTQTAHSHSHDGGHGHSHGGGGHGADDHDHDHDHEHEHEHGSEHPHDKATTVLTDAIDKVTESIAETISSALTSTTAPTMLRQRRNVMID